MFLTCSSFTIWNIWMNLHRYVDHQRLHIVTKHVISLSSSVLFLFRHYISHKITFGAPSSGGVLCSACGAFIFNFISFLHFEAQPIITCSQSTLHLPPAGFWVILCALFLANFLPIYILIKLLRKDAFLAECWTLVILSTPIDLQHFW